MLYLTMTEPRETTFKVPVILVIPIHRWTFSLMYETYYTLYIFNFLNNSIVINNVIRLARINPTNHIPNFKKKNKYYIKIILILLSSSAQKNHTFTHKSNIKNTILRVVNYCVKRANFTRVK